MRAWFGLSRHLRVLFVVLTLAVSALLLAFAWRFYQRVEVERKQLAAQREAAADLAVAALARALEVTDASLRDRDAVRFLADTPDSIAVIFDGGELEALPHGRLLYYPTPSPNATSDVPPELFARWSSCGLLAAKGETAALRTEALELRELLLDARWRITRPVFEKHLRAASEWAGAGEPPAGYRLALSDVVEQLWRSRKEGRPISRRGTLAIGGLPLTVLSYSNGDRTHALIAGRTYLERRWKAGIGSIEKRHGVRVALVEADQFDKASATSRRVAADTSLPWTIIVRSDK